MFRSLLVINTAYEGPYTVVRFHRTFLGHAVETRRYLRTRPIRLRPQTWHHMIITSSRVGTAVLVDCKPVRAAQSIRTTVAPSSWSARLGADRSRTVDTENHIIGYVGQKNATRNYWTVSHAREISLAELECMSIQCDQHNNEKEF
ncbi:unnamed protein product [Echinostoma caproni]|uniref:Uncharacterized protein n=1 Tax=Echinostoma caproni TaxID=27848 RepID=A0A3P8KYH4_9TREM|nr:unnamed protein product [Echinostoma caproni]